MIVYPRGVQVLDTTERTDGVLDRIRVAVQRRTGRGGVPGTDRRTNGHRPEAESMPGTGRPLGARSGGGGR